jgi:hypothetical protein
MKSLHRPAFALIVGCSLAAWSTPASAQQPGRAGTYRQPTPARPASPSADQFSVPNLSLPSVTPEMWVYSQEMRRHDDPAQAVRRKAEIRAAQRMQRIAAMKWFGLSNSRPVASVTPMMGSYSPAWIGNGYEANEWVGVEWPATAVRIESYDVRR